MVRSYLEYLADSDQGNARLCQHLAAIRTVFDKFCFLDITLGLVTPIRARKLPVVLSEEEVSRLISAATSRRDKLLLGMMYATGVRVGEVVRLRWRDIDLDRNEISIWQGKGAADRRVMLPESYRVLFASCKRRHQGDAFLFPSPEAARGSAPEGRHLSPRTVQRVIKTTLEIAGIQKRATSPQFRDS